MPFEVFDKRMAPLAKAPSVTIQKRGIFSINKAAHKLIGEPETLELLYDRDEQVIALRSSSAAHAYKLRPQSARDTGQVVLAATAFTLYFDIDTTVSRRWTPYEKDEMLCIDLKGKSVEIHGNRTKRASEASSEEPVD